MSYKIYSIEGRVGSCGECASCKTLDAPDWMESCWDWNTWDVVGTLDVLPFDNRDIIAALVERDLLRPAALKVCEVEDDSHNLVVVDKRSREPFFAVEYGENPVDEVEKMIRTHA